MCGIAAIIAYHPDAAPVDRGELTLIRDHMTSRGPDDSGDWYSSDGRIGLAHRRLSIIDLSERGRQPMANSDASLIVTYNGEIYNYKRLRTRLESSGYTFRTDSDTEVLLHLYADRGVDMLQELRGMFAFALWDNRNGKMLLARDPYGIKPLYYCDDGRSVRVASQVNALLAGNNVDSSVDAAGITGFFLLGSIPEPFTMYSSIKSVPAGCSVWIDDRGISRSRQYFSIPEILADARDRETGIRETDVFPYVRERLLESVADHMIADVPVGAFLSAGIDSGALVGLVRDTGITDLRTVTLAFEEYLGKHDDESPLASEVAGLYGTSHSTRLLERGEFDRDFENILDVMDQPSIDGINTYFVSKVAAESGLKVVLSGLGGDELFGGYNTFRDVPRWVGRLGIPSRIPFLGDVFRVLYESVMGRFMNKSPKIAGAVTYGGTYAGAYLLRRGNFLPRELSLLMPREIAAEGLSRLKPLGYISHALDPDPGTPFGRIASLEASIYMRNQLLRDSDWAGMAHSLELRVPLVDAFLLKDLAPVLIRYAPRFRKQLLAESPSIPLPEIVRNRAKTGFQVPVHSWLESGTNTDAWRNVPALARENCPWTRRWAYTLLEPVLRKLDS